MVEEMDLTREDLHDNESNEQEHKPTMAEETKDEVEQTEYENEQKNHLEIADEFSAAMDIHGTATDKFMYHLQKAAVDQSQHCQWIKLENDQNIKIIQCDLGQCMAQPLKPLFCVVERVSSDNGDAVLIDFGHGSILSKYASLGNPRLHVVSIDSNMRAKESCSFLVAAGFGRSAISNWIPGDVTRMIEHYCSRLFPKDLSIDVMNDLEAEDTYFDGYDFYARNKGDDDPQIAIVFYDGNIASLLCYLRADGIKMQIIENEYKFDECMAQTGYKKVTSKAMQIESIDLPFAEFRAFIEKERNFSAVSSVDIAYDLFVNYLDIKTWKTSDGLRWFLKALIKKYNSIL